MVFKVKYDPASNVKLIKCVEKFSIIYRPTTISKENKDIEAAAWVEISKEINCPVYDCRLRWNNLTGCYRRYLRCKTEKPTKKPYYLSKFMEFMKPYLFLQSEKAKKKKLNALNAPTHSETEDDDNITMLDIDMADSKFKMEECNDFPVKPVCIVVDSSEDEEIVLSTSVQNGNNDAENENPDFCFFKSLLPHINLMTPQQQMRFRKEILDAIDMTLYGKELKNIKFLTKTEPLD